jgi:hypothetical protein
MNFHYLISRMLLTVIPCGLLTAAGSYAQNVTVNIDGTVTGTPNNQPLSLAKVVLVRNDNGQRLDSTYTNQNGHYQKQFIVSYTGTFPDKAALNSAFPNPSADRTTIIFNAPAAGNYRLTVNSAEGQMIAAVPLNLQKGSNSILLQGGPAGTQLVRITGSGASQAYKIFRVVNSVSPVSFEIPGTGNHLKSMPGDIWPGLEVTLEFTRQGYYLADTSFIVETTQTVNMLMTAAATVQGTVTGNIYNNPVAGTKAVLYFDGNRVDSVFTDQSGQYTLTLPVTIPLYSQVTMAYTAPTTTYTNYLPGDTTFTVQASQTINKKLEQIPYVFTSTLKPFLETGEQISAVNPSWTTTIEWPDGETTTHSIANEEIQLQKEMYPLNNTLGTILMYHDTTTHNVGGVQNGVLNWIILRQPHQKTNRPNIAQSESSNHMANVSYTTPVPVDSLDNKTIYYYTIRKKAETQQGEYERLDSPFSRNLVEHSGGIKSSMFIDLKPFGVADSLDIVQKTWNETTGEQMSQSDIDRAMGLLMMAIQTRYLQNGDTLLPPHRIYTITSNNDPRWQAVIARGGANSIKSAYISGTPENQRAWSSTYTYNGELRINYTGGMYNKNNTDGTIFEEVFSAGTGETEGSGGLAPFIWNATTNQPSQYAYSISPIPALLNLGTGQNVKNSGNAKKRNELYSIHIEGQEPLFFETKKEMKEYSPEWVVDF